MVREIYPRPRPLLRRIIEWRVRASAHRVDFLLNLWDPSLYPVAIFPTLDMLHTVLNAELPEMPIEKCIFFVSDSLGFP